ncbi:hypothetical protein [Mesorhizobium sp. M0088]|uniref:hypothetical protein n=1 Tax=Mesorhizobium sp. M0088 TaxID=2956873 RepID=UPI00333B37D6
MTSIQIDLKDGLSSSVAIKGPCRAATTANITLSGEQTIDGVAVVTGDRVLVKDQTTASDNGIYVVDTGSWRRSKDFNKTRDVKTGTLVNVSGGTVGSGLWDVTTPDPITVGTTSISFALSVSGRFPSVASRAALKAVDTSKDTIISLTEAGRQGVFIWTAGNFSTQIAADTTEGLYVKATAIASTVGAWVRQFAGTIYSSWFGAVGDDATDNLSALTYAMARDEELIMLPGTYRISAELAYIGTGTKTVRGLGFNASVLKTTSATAHILRRNSASTLIVRDLGITTSVDKSAGAAIMLSGDGARDVVDNCRLHGPSGAVALYHGVYGETTLIPTISRNYFLSCKGDAIYFGRAVGTAGCEAVVTGNTFNTLVASAGNAVAIYWDSSPGTLRIYGNTFQNYDYGVLCQPLSSLTTAALLITGNAFEGIAVSCIAVSLPAASAGAVQDVTVTGNRFSLNTTPALQVLGATNQAFIGTVPSPAIRSSLAQITPSTSRLASPLPAPAIISTQALMSPQFWWARATRNAASSGLTRM